MDFDVFHFGLIGSSTRVEPDRSVGSGWLWMVLVVAAPTFTGTNL